VTDVVHPRQRALFLLSLGYSKTRTADEIGCSRNTITAWTRDPGFGQQLEQSQKDLTTFVQAQANAVAAHAVDRLAEHVDSTDPGVSLKAIGQIISLCHARATQQSVDSPMSESELDAKMQRIESRMHARRRKDVTVVRERPGVDRVTPCEE
jgi:hypothetical protein